jgi:hypothetical protein
MCDLGPCWESIQTTNTVAHNPDFTDNIYSNIHHVYFFLLYDFPFADKVAERFHDDLSQDKIRKKTASSAQKKKKKKKKNGEKKKKKKKSRQKKYLNHVLTIH